MKSKNPINLGLKREFNPQFRFRIGSTLGKTGYLRGEDLEELGASYFAAFFSLALSNHLAVSNPKVKLSDLSKEKIRTGYGFPERMGKRS